MIPRQDVTWHPLESVFESFLGIDVTNPTLHSWQIGPQDLYVYCMFAMSLGSEMVYAVAFVWALFLDLIWHVFW